MKAPYRGRFGAKDNSHSMLEWQGPSPAPVDLLGLTDKPPGSYAPGDRWWPALGCGPVGELWAVWWTVPDEAAVRGGMVRTELAGWPAGEADSIQDLGAVIYGLSGMHPEPEASGLLAEVCEAMLEHPPGRTVLVGLDVWPSVLVALWQRLWPAARRSFSARVAVSPPLAPESVAPPWLFAIPSERVPQWTGWRLVGPKAGRWSPGRASRWLAGEEDAALSEIFAGVEAGSDLSTLRRAARAADGLGAWRAEPDAQRALECLRTLLAIAPSPTQLEQLKSQALHGLSQGLAGAQPSLVFGLANLDSALVESDGGLETAVRGWVQMHGAAFGDEDLSRCLSLLSPGRAEEWWASAVRDTLTAALSDPDKRWSAAALRWLSGSVGTDRLDEVIPRSSRVEERLLAAAEATDLSQGALQRIRQAAARRKWSQLHAWALSRIYAASEALIQQQAFEGDALPGLTYLVDRLPADAVVAEAVRSRAPSLRTLVAQRTARAPQLLHGLDAADVGWRLVWAAHIEAGGTAWPPGVDATAAGGTLLDLAVDGVDVHSLVGSLARDLGSVAYAHARRGELWEVTRSPARGTLLAAVANQVVAAVDRGESVPQPEQPLFEPILAVMRQGTPSALMVVAALRWGLSLDEGQFVGWLRARRPSEWAAHGGVIGSAALARRWARAATAIYELALRSSDLVAAAEAVRDLLSTWERIRLSWQTAGRPPDDRDLGERVGILGAELLPDQLDEIWERAGGSRKKLSYGANPEERWRSAARLAAQGGLDGGLECLIEEIRRELPYNAELRELSAMVSAGRHRRW